MPNLEHLTLPRFLYIATLLFVWFWSIPLSAAYDVAFLYADSSLPVIDQLAYVITWTGVVVWVTFRLNLVLVETFDK